MEAAQVKRWLLVLLLIAAPVLADSAAAGEWADRQLPDPRQEAEAKALMEQLRCLVCQGQSIADSDAELAGDMRDMVRSGSPPAKARGGARWLVERYGNWVSYRPPVEPVTWPLGGALAAARRRLAVRKRAGRRRG